MEASSAPYHTFKTTLLLGKGTESKSEFKIFRHAFRPIFSKKNITAAIKMLHNRELKAYFS